VRAAKILALMKGPVQRLLRRPEGGRLPRPAPPDDPQLRGRGEGIRADAILERSSPSFPRSPRRSDRGDLRALPPGRSVRRALPSVPLRPQREGPLRRPARNPRTCPPPSRSARSAPRPRGPGKIAFPQFHGRGSVS
jgi:hypothetical protein